MASKWVKMKFLELGVNRKVVDNHLINIRKVADNVENYQNMKFQPKLMTPSRKNGQKPHFLKNCLYFSDFSAKIGLRHFSTLGTSYLVTKKQKKDLGPFMPKMRFFEVFGDFLENAWLDFAENSYIDSMDHCLQFL